MSDTILYNSGNKVNFQCALEALKFKRKKRHASQNPNNKECPKDFNMITNQLCIHYHDKNRTFANAEGYCKNVKGANLFGFSNSTETLQVWRWLGSICILYTVITVD